MFGIQVTEVKEAGGWSASVKVVPIRNVLEIFPVILLLDHSINVLMGEELED